MAIFVGASYGKLVPITVKRRILFNKNVEFLILLLPHCFSLLCICRPLRIDVKAKYNIYDNNLYIKYKFKCVLLIKITEKSSNIYTNTILDNWAMQL